ncbi:unnamed protein product [Somion occarium]|uniref:Protein kinase domain-containing protein n=1 Tax=Somion occarium TaxID=3059160 RepID=A0ABP1DXA9_9APHY
MSSSIRIPAVTASTTVALTALVYCIRSRWLRIQQKRRANKIRDNLPQNLIEWRLPGTPECEEIWEHLDSALSDNGLKQWVHSGLQLLHTPDDGLRMASGYAYVTPTRETGTGPGTVEGLTCVQYINPIFRIARTTEGHDVAIRVVAVKDQGHEQLRILKKVASGCLSLLSNNHSLPMLRDFEFEDITFGIFPLVGGCLDDAYGYWARNSVGDIIDMVMQALEGLAFLHEQGIAHRDADKSNFLVQWHPESLRTMTVARSRPRVYIIDFEVSVEFPPGSPKEACMSMGPPVGGTIPVSGWNRELPPEVQSGKPYSPFKLDVWQFGYSLITLRSTIPAIDQVFAELVIDDPVVRPSANVNGTILCLKMSRSISISLRSQCNNISVSRGPVFGAGFISEFLHRLTALQTLSHPFVNIFRSWDSTKL